MDREFYHRIQKNRVDPSFQSVNNPAPDFYGEKVSRLVCGSVGLFYLFDYLGCILVSLSCGHVRVAWDMFGLKSLTICGVIQLERQTLIELSFSTFLLPATTLCRLVWPGVSYPSLPFALSMSNYDFGSTHTQTQPLSMIRSPPICLFQSSWTDPSPSIHPSKYTDRLIANLSSMASWSNGLQAKSYARRPRGRDYLMIDLEASVFSK